MKLENIQEKDIYKMSTRVRISGRKLKDLVFLPAALPRANQTAVIPVMAVLAAFAAKALVAAHKATISSLPSSLSLPRRRKATLNVAFLHGHSADSPRYRLV